MSNEMNRDFYITGKPIATKFGSIRFLTYLEYLEHASEINTIRQNVLHIYYLYRNQFDSVKINLSSEEKIEVEESLKNLKSSSLYDFMKEDKSIEDAYLKIFKLVLDNEDGLNEIMGNADVFMKLREVVMDMNFISEDEVNPNEEIQGYLDNAKKAKQRDVGKHSFSDLVSSIVVGVGVDYDIVFNWTVLRVHAAYYRLAAMKDYDTSTLFATVSEKPQISSWAKHVNLFENEKEGMSMEKFNKQFGGLF